MVVCRQLRRAGRRRRHGRRRQPAGALVLARAAGARVGRQAAVRARAQRAVPRGPGAPPPRAARAQLNAPRPSSNNPRLPLE